MTPDKRTGTAPEMPRKHMKGPETDKEGSGAHELSKMFGSRMSDEDDAEPDKSADDDEMDEEAHAGAMKDAGEALLSAHRDGDGHRAARAIHAIMDLKRDHTGETDKAESTGL